MIGWQKDEWVVVDKKKMEPMNERLNKEKVQAILKASLNQQIQFNKSKKLRKRIHSLSSPSSVIQCNSKQARRTNDPDVAGGNDGEEEKEKDEDEDLEVVGSDPLDSKEDGLKELALRGAEAVPQHKGHTAVVGGCGVERRN